RVAIKRSESRSVVRLNAGVRGDQQAVVPSSDPAHVVIGQTFRDVEQLAFASCRIECNHPASGGEPQPAIAVFKNMTDIISGQRFDTSHCAFSKYGNAS